MSLDRGACMAAFARAVAACDPERLVAGAAARVLGPLDGRTRYGLAIGKAALKMARGAGPVARGVIATTADDGLPVPSGWRVWIGAHPEPDARSLAAGEAVLDLVASASANDVIVALISGGASALVEWPRPGVTLDELRARVAACMASGADIHTINRLRGELSALKGGKLARLSAAPIATLAISDVYDDDLAVIGSGPTIANRPGDHAAVIAKMRLFSQELARLHPDPPDRLVDPVRGPVAEVAVQLAAWAHHPLTTEITTGERRMASRLVPRSELAWGEPTIVLPADHGEGGRAQHLALTLARELRGTMISAFVAGSDGIDGPAPRGRPAPAGAFVDHRSWERIAGEGIDPELALARCDAGTALDAIGALVVTGPTGINHGDIVVVG